MINVGLTQAYPNYFHQCTCILSWDNLRQQKFVLLPPYVYIHVFYAYNNSVSMYLQAERCIELVLHFATG